MFDDVGDFVGDESEINRHQNASRPAHTKETGEQSRRVLTDDRHARALRDTDFVQAGCLGPSESRHLQIRLRSPRLGWLVWLINEGDAIWIDLLGPTQMINDGQWNFQRSHPRRLVRRIVVPGRLVAKVNGHLAEKALDRLFTLSEGFSESEIGETKLVETNALILGNHLGELFRRADQ